VRVLHLITELDIGGAERQLLALARALHQTGCEITVAYLHGHAPLQPAFHDAGIEVFALASRHKADPAAFLRLRRLVQQTQPDILHTHLIQADHLGAWAGAPITVSTKHSLDYFRNHPNWLVKLDRRVNHRFARFIAVSQVVKDHYCTVQKIPANKIDVIPNGIETALFANATPISRTSLNVPGNAPLIGCVGTISERKGQADLIAAMPDVWKHFPTAILLLVGDGPTRRDLEKQASDRIRFLGHRDDIPAILHALDLYVQPSHTEGLPLAVIEAMAAGRPIVATNVGGIPEVTGEVATLVPAHQPTALAAAIVRQLQTPGNSEASRQRAAEFTIQRTADRHTVLYQTLRQQGRKRAASQSD
jgi:glycosyltransferase involved in cell wall biosynthesis